MAFFTETSGSQRSDGVQSVQKRLAHQPLRRAQDFPRVADVRMLRPGHAGLYSDLPGVSDHNVSHYISATCRSPKHQPRKVFNQYSFLPSRLLTV